MQGAPRRHFKSVDSTFSAARAWAEDSAPHGAMVTAEVQTHGRGRSGRSWTSPPGGLYLTLVLRPGFPEREWPLVSLAAAVAAAESVRSSLPEALIKWPNDVVAAGRKVAGLLIESGGTAGSRYLLLGVGINVGQESAAFAEKALEHAASLSQLAGSPVDAGALLEAFLCAFALRFGQLENGLAPDMLSAYRELSATIGRRVSVLGAGAARTGAALDIMPDGSLLFQPDGGPPEAVYAADVSVRGLMGYAD